MTIRYLNEQWRHRSPGMFVEPMDKAHSGEWAFCRFQPSYLFFAVTVYRFVLAS